MQKSHSSKKVRVVLQDRRIIEGSVLKCDLYMNTIISKSLEFRLNNISHKWEKRKIGLCVIRGNSISTISLI
jgi:small nuclear ribonucleoprotein (snRNP)-like protein